MNTSRWSLNQLLVLLGTGAQAVIFIPLGIYLILIILHLTDGSIVKNGRSLAVTLAGQIVDHLLVDDKLSLLDSLEKAAAANGNIVYLCVEDTQKNIVSHTFRNGFPPGLRELLTSNRSSTVKFRSSDGPVVDISAPIMEGRMGVLHIGFSRKQAAESLMHLFIVLALGAIASLVLFSLMAWFVSVKISGPISVLEKEVSRLTLDRMTDVSLDFRGIGEIESLARGFNEMAHRFREMDYERSVIQTKMIHMEHMSALGELAAGLSHEIRNPLDGVLECVRYIEADPQNKDRQAKFLPMIREGLQRINDVISNMLMFSRSGESVSAEVSYTTDVLNTLEVLLQGKMKSQNTRLTWKRPKDCQCLSNKMAMVQALMNLVLNAFDAVKDKHSAEIVIEAKCDDHWVYMTVEDSGDGIAPGLGTKIFEPFYTTKSPGKGTGLGLSISRQIVRAVGGDLNLSARRSSLGGARFEVRIPRAYQKDCDCV